MSRSRSFDRRRFLSGAAGLAAGALLPARLSAAVPGVSPLEIRLGTSLSLSGIKAQRDHDYLHAFLMVIDEQNAAGGVHDRRLTLFALDHGDDPRRAPVNTLTLLHRHDVFALTAFGDCSAMVRVLPLLQARDLPLFGCLSAAETLYQPPHSHWVTALRPSFGQEMEEMARQMKRLSIRRLGLCYSSDAEGRALVDALGQACRHHGIAITAQAGTAPMSRSSPPQLSENQFLALGQNVDGVFCALDAERLSQWLPAAEQASWRLPIFLPSTVAAEHLTARLAMGGPGPADRRLYQTRVVPSLDDHHPSVARFKELGGRRRPKLLKTFPAPPTALDKPWTAAGLEGFYTAHALIRTLDELGPDPHRNPTRSPLSSNPPVRDWRSLDSTGAAANQSAGPDPLLGPVLEGEALPPLADPPSDPSLAVDEPNPIPAELIPDPPPLPPIIWAQADADGRWRALADPADSSLPL